MRVVASGLKAWFIVLAFVIGIVFILFWVLKLLIWLLPAIILIIVLAYLFRWLNKVKKR